MRKGHVGGGEDGGGGGGGGGECWVDLYNIPLPKRTADEFRAMAQRHFNTVRAELVRALTWYVDFNYGRDTRIGE